MYTLFPRQQNRGNGPAACGDVHPLELFRRFDKLFDRLLTGTPTAPADHATAAWGANLRETEKEIVISFDAPGFEANEFDIQASEDTLTVNAEHKVGEGEEARTERTLKREVALPALVDPSKVEAKYRNGVSSRCRQANRRWKRWK